MNIFWKLFLFAAILPTNIFSQSSWFKTYDPGFSSVQRSYGLLEFDNGYFVLLNALNLSVPKTNNGIIKFDLEGNHKWTSIAAYPPVAISDILPYYPRSFVVSKDSFIYFLSSATNWYNEFEFLVNKFDKNGTLIWFKTFGIDSTSLSGGYRGLTLAPDSLGLVMAGHTLDGGRYIVIQTDSSGTSNWSQIFNVPVLGQIGFVSPIACMPDSTYRIAYDNNVLTDFRDYFGSLDKMGNPQFFYTNPLTGRAEDLKVHPSGNLVYLSHERNPPIFEHGGIRIQMLTPQLDTIWSYFYNDLELPYPFIESGIVLNLSISPDGKILAAGYGTKYVNLVCLSAAGNLLWKRKVAIEGEIEAGYNRKSFNDAIWTSDGGILIDGYIYGTINSAYAAKLFLLKLDSLGCFEPGCALTILTNTAEKYAIGNACWSISPNPASDQITGYLDAGCLGTEPELQVELIDLTGRLVAQQEVITALKFEINTQSLHSGLYLIRLSNRYGISQPKKVVVNNGSQ